MAKTDSPEVPSESGDTPGPIPTRAVEPGAGDPVLGAIAALLLVGEGNASLTVFVGGRVITGTAVSPSRWYAAAANDVGATGTGDAAETLAQLLRDMGEGAGETEVQQRDLFRAGGVDARPRALHFVDAFLQDGPRTPPTSIGDWRIQFDRIDGWRFGGAKPISSPGE